MCISLSCFSYAYAIQTPEGQDTNVNSNRGEGHPIRQSSREYQETKRGRRELLH